MKNAIRAFSNLAKLPRRGGLAARETPAFSRRFGAAFLAATQAADKSTACSSDLPAGGATTLAAEIAVA